MTISREPAPELETILFEKSAPSDLAVKGPLIAALTAQIIGLELVDESACDGIEVALDEAFTNAIVHGNASHHTRQIRARLGRNQHEWAVEIEDQGHGFAAEQIPDPDDPDFPWRESGRGIHMMRHYAERVEFYNGGRTVVLTWKLSPAVAR